jgi:hypothetical protein
MYYKDQNTKRRAVDFQSCKRFAQTERNQTLKRPRRCEAWGGALSAEDWPHRAFAPAMRRVRSTERNQATMEQPMSRQTPTTTSTTNDRKASNPSVRDNVTAELQRLRDELSRTVEEIRMKTKDASAEVQDTRKMLEREAERFGAEVEEAVDRTQEDLVRAGQDLRKRFQKLASEIGASAS